MGFLDKRETGLIRGIKDMKEDTTELKRMGHLLRATRRDEVSAGTLQAIKRLSVAKQGRMEKMAFKLLIPFDFEYYKKKTAAWFTRPARVNTVTLKIPFGKIRCVQRETLEVLRKQL